MSINGFTVQHSDGIKTADYAPPRTTSITANVVVLDGQSPEHALDAALALVIDRVRRSLHGTVTAHPTTAAPQPEPTPQGETEAPRRTRRTKAQIEADEAAARAARSGGESGDAGTSGDAFPEEPEEPAPATETTDEWGSPPAEVSDADLVKAVTEKNAQLQAAGMTPEAAPVLIRELIASYNPDPTKAFALKEVPTDKRADFVAKLAAIQPKK